MEALEVDRAARLAVIEEQGRRLGHVEAERNNLRAEVTGPRHQIKAQQEQIDALLTQLRTVQSVVQTVLRTRIYRVVRRSGRWKFIERAFDEWPASRDGN